MLTDQQKQQVTQLCQTLVRSPSTSGHEDRF